MLLPNIRFGNITLKNLIQEEVTQDYVNWLIDPTINRFLEVRHTDVNLESQKAFVENVNMSNNSSLFGIFFEHTEFVGTVKIGNLNKIHKTADIGILIGAASHHGMGIGSGTIKALCESLRGGNLVRKLNAGVISTNLPSLRAFEKNGFLREGLRNKQFLGPNGNAEDEILFGKFL